MKQAAATLFFYIGIVGLATTWFLAKADVNAMLFTIPAIVVVAFVLAVQGAPLLLLLAADRAIHRVAPGRLAVFRTSLIAAVAMFWSWHLAGRGLVEAVRNLPSGLALDVLILAGFLVIMVTWSVGVWRLCRVHQSKLAELVRAAGAASVIATIVIATLMALPGPVRQQYELTSTPVAVDSHPSLPPTFVVVFDELSYPALLDERGQLDQAQFPNFSRLAEQSVVFGNVSTNYFNTHEALPNIVEAVEPLAAIADVKTHLQFRAAELTIEPGCGVRYECRGISQTAHEQRTMIFRHMLVATSNNMLPMPFDIWLRGPMNTIARSIGVPASAADAHAFHLFNEIHFEQFLDDIRQGAGEPALYLFHTNLPHFPFIYEPGGQLSRDPFVLRADGRIVPAESALFRTPAREDESEAEARFLRAYRNQIGYADHLLGRLLDELEVLSLLEESVLVVTSDHGLRSKHALAGDPVDVDDWAAHVPLIVRAPGLTPGYSDVEVLQIDLGATMLDLLGVEADLPPAAVSAFSTSRPARTPWLLIENRWLYHRGEDRLWSLIGELPGDTVVNRALWDCLGDPQCQALER